MKKKDLTLKQQCLCIRSSYLCVLFGAARRIAVSFVQPSFQISTLPFPVKRMSVQQYQDP